MSDYLSHHGVKGVKWGVRKDKDKAHRQSAISGYAEVAQKIRTTEKTVDTKSSQGVNVKAGSTLYRTHRAKQGKKLGDYSYFSTNGADAAQYRGIMPSMREGVVNLRSSRWIPMDLFARLDAGLFPHGTSMSLRRILKRSDNIGRAERIG